MQPKAPSASSVEATHLVLPSDTNVHGTAFGGRIMQWMDIAAAVSAGRHCLSPCVTVAVDDLVFAKPIRMGDVVIVKARVNYTGKTSMEVGVCVQREDAQSGAREHCLSAYFTFVAVNAEGKPIGVPALRLESREDERRYQAAEQRRERRLKHTH